MRRFVSGLCLLATALVAGCGQADAPPESGAATGDGGTSTEFAVDLPEPWREPPTATAEEFETTYRNMTGASATLRAYREDPQGGFSVALFVTVEPIAAAETLEDAHAADQPTESRMVLGRLTAQERTSGGASPAGTST